MRFEERLGLHGFLDAYPEMRVRPSPSSALRLEGEFGFRADYRARLIIEDAYRLQVNVSRHFPKDLPKVLELDERIPRQADYHVSDDGTLCLGSPLRLYLIAFKHPHLIEFAKRSLVPYLYANSYREQKGTYPFGELAHGVGGELDDYAQFLGLEGPGQATEAIALMAMKRRLANKRPCPCGCGMRLGVCRFNETIRRLRSQLGRTVFKQLYNKLS